MTITGYHRANDTLCYRTVRALAVLFLLIAVGPSSVCTAQKRKNVAKSKKTEVVEQESPLFLQMLESTQRVMFIDSMVVPKSDFYCFIPLSSECGQLLQKNGVGQYTSEMGDRRVEALRHRNDTTTFLATSDFIGGQWTEPTAVRGLGGGDANFPYLMPDGTTLYFSQKADNALGGYDIYVTRYNPETGAYLRPENIGMPFSSKANDYLYVIDEPMQLGYFVTDRRQPAGMVCIYVFVPSATRRVYQSEAYTEEQLRSFAAINSIADTWSDRDERVKAQERLAQARQAYANRVGSKDDVTVQLSELDELRRQAENEKKSLASERKDYTVATDEAKALMKDNILRRETELEELLQQIRQKEKEERNKKIQSQQ